MKKIFWKFGPACSARARARGLWSFSLTVLEAENSRSSKVADMGVYRHGLIYWFQNGIKHKNRTKNGELSLHKQHQIHWFNKIDKAFEVKVRHFLSDFDVFYRFGITESRQDRRHPYRPLLLTSNFWPPVLWGWNFRGRAHARALSRPAQTFRLSFSYLKTALRRAA